jgi:signal transduction histidine kinase/ligand-binding sensor domain-containing protein
VLLTARPHGPGFCKISRGDLSKLYARLIIACCFLALAGSSPAVQPYSPTRADPTLDLWRWQKLSELDGKFPHCMAAGTDGAMWFGVANGVMRYDGINWTNFPPDNAPAGTINALCAGKNGDLLAATSKGISLYSNGKWTRCFPASTNYDFPVTRVSEATDGTIWAGGDGVLAHILGNHGKFYCRTNFAAGLGRHFPGETVVSLPPNRLKGVLQAICQTRDGSLWFAFDSGEVDRMDPRLAETSTNAWKNFSSADGFHSGVGAQFLCQSSDGLLWSGNAQHNVGLNQFDSAKGTWSYFRLNDVLGSDDITLSMTQAPDGTVWVGGMSKLFRYQDGQWRMYHSPQVPVTSAEVCGLVFANDYLWLLGQDDGVQKIDVTDKNWVKYRQLNFECETPDARQWFLTASNDVICFDGTRWQRYGVEDGLMPWPSALLCTRPGKLWASGGDPRGAATAYFDGARWHERVHTNMLSLSFEFRAATEARDGCLWFGTYVDGSAKIGEGGLLRYNPAAGPPEADGAWTAFLHGNHSTSYGFANKNDGTLYSGSYLGLIRFDGKQWVHSALTGSERIDALCNSPDGRDLWIGTRAHGVYRWDGSRVSKYTRRDGLGADSIGGLFCDRDSHLWVMTSSGVSYFDGTEWVADLLPAKGLGSDGGSVRQSRDGAFWINQCGRNWMRRILPDAKVEDRLFEDFWTLRYQRRIAAPHTQILTGADRVPQPGNLHLAWQGVDPWSKTRDADLLYSYRLNRGPWSKFLPETHHEFLELPKGNYVFEVRARDQDMNVDATPARATFVVLPPVWQQAWFLGLMALLLAAIGTQTLRVILHGARLRAANQSLAGEVEVRKAAEVRLQAKSGLLEAEVRQRKSIEAALEEEKRALKDEIEERRRIEAEMARTHKELLAASHKAGMAEVATSVLHNVGNVLNSINVSTTLVHDAVRKSRVNNVGRLASLLQEHRDHLPAFFSGDPRGRQLPEYLTKLAEHLAAEQGLLTSEVELTRKNVEHIKDIVAMQQSYARVSGVAEKVLVTDLVEDALRMNSGGLARHDVHMIRDYPADAVEINVERQKVLQILVNLIRNAKHACDESGRPDKQMTMRVRTNGDALQIVVQDNGVGIPAENLTRIFHHGFTTRKDGHGFGLHGSALAAKELGGTLNGSSDGPGKGATFVLELPRSRPAPSS